MRSHIICLSSFRTLRIVPQPRGRSKEPSAFSAKQHPSRFIADDQRAATVIQRLRALFKRDQASLESVDVRELISEVLSLSRAELIRRQVRASVMVQPHGGRLWAENNVGVGATLKFVLPCAPHAVKVASEG